MGSVGMKNEKLLDLFLSVNAFLSFGSAAGNLLAPERVANYYYQYPSVHSRSEIVKWVQMIAGGDILIVYLCLVGLLSRKNDVLRRLSVRSVVLYTCVNNSVLWYDHLFRSPHPPGMKLQYMVNIAFILFA